MSTDSTISKLIHKANQIFYEMEKTKHPNGDTPYSDHDRLMFISGWLQGYLFLNSMEGVNQNDVIYGK